MADIRLAKPVAGTTQTVPSAPDGRFIFDFPADAATLTRNGDDLVLSFEDGSSIRLQGFYTTYSKEEMPSFQVEGVEISGQDFFAALGEDLMPAAGPAAGSSASRGGRYNEYGGSDLLDGIDHLGRLDIGFGDGVEWADDQVGGWTHQNLDPEISGIIAVDGNDMTLVESGVETDGSQEIQGNVFTPGVPVVVGQVMASDPDGGRLSYSFADGSNRIATEYGVITIDADTGVITYTLNNDDPDADSLALGETVRQDFTVRVEDGQGGKAEASFSVTIKGTNDQPEVTLDADSELGLIESGVGRIDSDTVVDAPGTEEENREYNGSHYDPGRNEQHLEGKVTGADVDAGHKLWFGAVAGDKSQDGGWEGAQSPDADIFLGKDATDGDVESSEPVEGNFGSLQLNSDGTWVYTLKGEGELVQGTASLDGETFDISSIDSLPEGATITDTFTIYVKDEHGAWNLETVTITITGTNDKPALEVGEQQGLVYESGVGRDPVTDAPVDDPAGSLADENVEYDNTERGTNTTTGTITASDVDLGNTLHFAVSKKGEATEIPQNSLTDTDRPVTAQGNYGTLEVKETGNGEATYTYTLNENSDDIPLSVPVTINGKTYDDLEALKAALGFEGDELTLNNLPEGAEVKDTFTIFVQDDKGAWVSKDVTITITGTNDQPTVELDREHSQLHLFESGVGRDNTTNEVVDVPEEENTPYNGSKQLTGKVTGHDVDAGDKLYFGVVHGDTDDVPANSIFLSKESTDTSVESSDPVSGIFGTLTLNSDGTWIYTLKSEQVELPEGTTVTLDGKTFDIGSINALPEGAEVTDTFTIYVKDEHGAWNLETVTITITGTNDKPELTLKDAAGDAVSADVPLVTTEHDPDAPDASDASAGWPEVSGRFEIADVDADAGLDQTIRIEGGSHTEDGKDYITNGDSSDGHIGSEGGGDTSATFITDYGTLTVNPDGSWTYVVNSESESVQQLDPRNPHYETFEITVVDEHGAYDTKEIVIKLTGKSEQPTIETAENLVFKEEGVYDKDSDGNTETTEGPVLDADGHVNEEHHSATTLEGKVTASDVDLGDQGKLIFSVKAKGAELTTDGELDATQPQKPAEGESSSDGTTVYESDYGTLTFHANGTYTYTLNSGAFDTDDNEVNKLAQGQVLTETFTVTVKDTFGKEVSTDITITIHGTNDKPRLELGDSTLHVTESGVGRHEDGTVVDGPDDELVDEPSKKGTATDEIDDYGDALTDSGNAAGSDADNNAHLVYGAAKGEAAGATLPEDFATTDAPVTVEGLYGKLTIDANGRYTYELNEESDFTTDDGQTYSSLDQLNEGETLTETFTIFVKDEHGAWASKEVTVTVTGTNDRPELEVLDDKTFFDDSGNEVSAADDHLHAYGTADTAVDAVVKLTGRVQASDVDLENGGGKETTSGDNHGLEFSLQEKGYDSTLTSSSVWKDSSGHGLGSGTVGVSPHGDGGYVATTPYGTLTLDQYGNYTYKLGDNAAVTALGEGETVTETFVVRVVDDRGAWREETITITIKGTNDKPVLSEETNSSLDVNEKGVWGSQDKIHGPDDDFTEDTGAQTGTVTFSKQDAHDTHSLVIGDSLSLGDQQPLEVTYPDNWPDNTDGATYSITANADGTYTLEAIIPGVNGSETITLGELKLGQGGEDGTLTYTFTPNQDGLNGLPQDMDLKIDIPLQVQDQHGSRSDGEHTATINIHGTNDRPTIKITGWAPEDVYADGVGRVQGSGDPVNTSNKKELNPTENEVYESQKVEGQLTASDVDAGDTPFSYFVDKVSEISDSALTATVGDNSTTVTLSLNGVAVAELTLDPATGKYSLTLLDGDDAQEALEQYGEDVKFDFTVHFNVRDEHGSTAQTSASQKFTIHGSNDAPEIRKAGGLELEEGGEDKSKTAVATDPDTQGPKAKLTFGLLDQEDGQKLLDEGNSERVEMRDSIETDYGFLEIDPNTGKYTFHLDNSSDKVISLAEGQEKELTFYVAVRDDKGAWDVQEITVTITGKDTATVFTGDAAVVTVVEEGVIPKQHPGENAAEAGVSSASGRLEAKDFDTDEDGKQHEVEFSIKTKEEGTEPEKMDFGELNLEVQESINSKFTAGDAWADDADIQILTGTYGTLYLNTATGQYFYQLNNDWDATQDLELGQIEYDEFIIHAQGPSKGEDGGDKGADQPLKVAVQGSNDAPRITEVTLDKASTEAGLDVTESKDGFTVTGLEEDGGETEVKGSVVATDVDSPYEGAESVLKYLIKVEVGGKVSYLNAWDSEYGYLSLQEDGSYTFVLDNKAAQGLKEGEPGYAKFTVVAVDEHNAVSEEKELTFTITGTDDAPIVNDSRVSVTEDQMGKEIGSIKIDDLDTNDQRQFTFISSKAAEESPVDLTNGTGPWIITGEYGILTVTRNEGGELTYEYKLNDEGRGKLQHLNVDSTLKEEFSVHGQSGDDPVTSTITVTITGENDAPKLKLEHGEGTEIENGAIQVDSWEPVKGEANGWDVDNRWDKDEKDPELRYSVSNSKNPGSEPGEDGEVQASSLQTIKGEFGYLTINSVTGEYTYVVDPFSKAYQGLKEGGSGQETFTIWVKDPHGAYDKQEIVFDVTKVEGTEGGELPDLKAPEYMPEVTEDDGQYDVTLPPYVERGPFPLETEDGPLVNVPADQIWLADADGNKSHVIETAFGSLILEKGKNGEWGYRFVLNNSSKAVQELNEDAPVTLHFKVGIGEHKGFPITVTIKGINDQPVIESIKNLEVKDTGGVAEGWIRTSDPDKEDVGNTEATEAGTQPLTYRVEETGGVSLTNEVVGEDGTTYTVEQDGKVLGKFTLYKDGHYTFTPDENIAYGLPEGENEEFDLKITVDDGQDKQNSTVSDTIHITIEGTNAKPVITDKELTLEVKEDEILTNGKQLVVTDDRGNGPDNLSFFVAAGNEASEGKPMAVGKYGTLFIDAHGHYHYQLNNQLPEVQQLGGRDDEKPLTDTFTIFVKDKDGAVVKETVTVNIKGTNDDPVLSLNKPVLTIKEGTDGPVTGNALATDVDKGDQENLTYSLQDKDGKPVGEGPNENGEYVYETPYGTFYLNQTTGEYHFVLDNTLAAVKNLRPTDVATATVTVVVSDGQGSTTKDLTVHIKGDNTAPEVTDEESLELTVLENAGENSGQIDATGWDSGPNNTGSDPLRYSAENAKTVTIDGEIWQQVKGDHGILYINPKTGVYRYELTKDMNYLADGDTESDDFSITITDSAGLKTEETIKVTIKGENDAPSIVVSQPAGDLSGIVTITDVDTSDTHEVTFTGLYGSAEDATNGTALQVDLTKLENGKPLDVFNAKGEKIGELTLTYTKGEDAEDKLEYKFEPNEDYLNSLPVGKDTSLDFGITVSDNHDGTDTENGLHFTVTNPNDAPEIDEDASQLPSEENNNEGKLKFSDADVKDTHSVTFNGLYAGVSGEDGEPLKWENVESLKDYPEGKTLAVFNKDGLQIGTLKLTYEDGELTYTLSTDDFENNLPVGESSISFDLTVTDAQGLSDQLVDLDFSVSNENDAPVIDDAQSQGPAEGNNTGTLVFTDADVRDTHSVTFTGLTTEGGKALTVDLDSLTEEGKTVDVYQGGQKIGTLELHYAKGEDGKGGTLDYTFKADDGYLNGLEVGEDKDISFGITVSDNTGDAATEKDLNFTVTNPNDAPEINAGESEAPSAGNNTGKLVFTDADVRDTHSVTFEGLTTKNETGEAPLTVELDNLPETPIDVYQDGQKVGTLELTYIKGGSAGGTGTEHTLTYTFTPDEGYLAGLPRGEESTLDFSLTVSDGTKGSDPVVVTIPLESTNKAPEIDAEGIPGEANSNNGTVAITDSDIGDSLTVFIKDAGGTPVIITAGGKPVTVDGVSYTYTDGTLRYEVLPELTEGMEPGKEDMLQVTVVVDDGHGEVERLVSLPVTSTAPTEGGEGEGTTEGKTVIVPDDGNQASLKADGQRQRLAAEEAGLLTAAASFVAGITPEPADPETFLQDTVPVQEDAPEAFVAEEIPLPQDETVPQEETADLPDADVPVSEMPLADDLLAEPLLFAGLESTEGMPEPVETLRPETADDTLLAEETDPVTAATPPAFSGEEAGTDGLLLPEGVEGLFGTDGDDYLRGGEGSDAIFGGAGNDIIVYDQQDYLVSGGSGIDFMVSDDTSLTLDGLLSNTSSDKPLVSGIEVLLKGEDALSLTSIKDLADRYGITLGVNEAGEETLQLDDRWTKQEDGSYDFNGGAEADGGLTLETNLTPVETGDPASEAVQQQVFTLEHSNG